jgi:hypothetical protein
MWRRERCPLCGIKVDSPRYVVWPERLRRPVLYHQDCFNQVGPTLTMRRYRFESGPHPMNSRS